MAWVYLVIAIATEVLATLGLRRIAEHMSWTTVALVAVAYGVSFTSLTVSLRQLNVGIVYALWSALGTAAVSVAGVVLFGERLTRMAIVGLLLIVAGVAVLVASGSTHHA
jgi:small multidrug resistance pump